MKTATVNRILNVSYPDGFDVMDAETLKQVYLNDHTDRWGIWDREKHIIMSVFYHQSSRTVIKLFGNAKSVAESTQARLKKGFKKNRYKFLKYYDAEVAGLKAYGFDYEYEIQGIEQTASAVVFIKDDTCYTVYFYARKNGGPDDRRIFEAFLESVSFS